MNETDVFILEHFGTKGMRWGVRKARSETSGNGQGKTKEEKRSRNKKIAAAVLVTAGVGATAVILSRNHNLKMKDISTSTKRLADVRKLIHSNGSKPVSRIPQTSAAHKKFISDMMQKQFRLNAAANEDLKKLYTMNDTPIHMRDYLPILPGQTFGRRG